MDDSPLIREARPRDLDRIAELERLTFDKIAWPVWVLREQYLLSGPMWLVAEDDEGVGGYLLAARHCEDRSVAWIQGLAVHPDRQGKGYGKALLVESMTMLRDVFGIKTIRLLVKPHNEVARRLYEQEGFRHEVHIAKDFFGAGEDRVVLTVLL